MMIINTRLIYFLAHINNVLTCEREQRILIDWLAYVVQNAGKRINWAILLQGAQGTGKSYFAKVLGGCLVLTLRALTLAHWVKDSRGGHGSVVNIVEKYALRVMINGASWTG